MERNWEEKVREGEGEEERKGDRKERQNETETETETGFLGIRMVGIYIGIVLLGMSRREWERLGIKEERNMILMEKIRLGLRIRMRYYFYYYNNNYMKKKNNNNNNYKELESRTFGGKGKRNSWGI